MPGFQPSETLTRTTEFDLQEEPRRFVDMFLPHCYSCCWIKHARTTQTHSNVFFFALVSLKASNVSYRLEVSVHYCK